jgi:hypothetical protein
MKPRVAPGHVPGNLIPMTLAKKNLVVTLSWSGRIFRLPVEADEDSPFFRTKLRNLLECNPVVLGIEEEP